MEKDRYALSGVPSEIKLYFDVGNAEIGMLQSIFVIAYFILAPLIGFIGDKA